MNENEKKIEELNASMEKWQDEIDNIWSKQNTAAAQDEIRNLKNLINNAKREISELEGNEQGQSQVEEINPEDILENLKSEEEREINEKGRLKSSLERLNEEREDYKDNNDLYEEYTRKIEEVEKELGKLEMSQTEKYKRITTLKINLEGLKEKREKFKDNKDEYEKYTKTISEVEKEYEQLLKKEEEKEKNIKILTRGKTQEEKEKSEIEKEINKKQQEISEIEYDTENAMEEVELSSGEKVMKPKVLRLYKELDELKERLKGKDDKIKEYQDAIDKLKGIDKEQSKPDHELTPDEARYFHGQGDLREYGGENGEDTRKNRLDNDKYFAENTTDAEQSTPDIKEGYKNGPFIKGKPKVEKQKVVHDDFAGIEALDIDETKDIYSSSKDTIKNIKIDASSGKAYVISTRGNINEIDIEDAMKSKKEIFKDIKIDELLEKRNLNTFFKKRQIKKMVNPVVLSAIQSDPALVDEYLDNVLYWDELVSFDYDIDLNNPNLSKKSFKALKKIAKEEKRRGLDVKGLDTKRSKRKLDQLPEPETGRTPNAKEKKNDFVNRMNQNVQGNNITKNENAPSKTSQNVRSDDGR